MRECVHAYMVVCLDTIIVLKSYHRKLKMLSTVPNVAIKATLGTVLSAMCHKNSLQSISLSSRFLKILTCTLHISQSWRQHFAQKYDLFTHPPQL